MTLIQFDTAKLAKEKGFDLITENRYFFNSELTTKTPTQSSKPTLYAPTQSELQKYLREEHDIHVNISTRFHNRKLGEKLYYTYEISTKQNNYNGYCKNLDIWMGLDGDRNVMYRIHNSYEEALEFGLYEALKLIENDNN